MWKFGGKIDTVISLINNKHHVPESENKVKQYPAVKD